jgi:hypothetical protein
MNGGPWIERNYQFLETWSKRWHPEEWAELIAHYCLYIDSNWSKFSTIPDGEDRLRFSQTWMKNNVRWMNSDFNKSIRVNDLTEEFDIYEEGEDHFLDVMCETDRPDIRDFMMDISKRYSESDVDKIVKLRAIYIELETYERVLWDLYFNQMLSMRDIGKKLDLPLSSIFNMVKDLKIKVKEKCGI